MLNRDAPIILTRPPGYRPVPPISLGEPDTILEDAARRIFAELGISSIRFFEPPMPNQDYRCFWSGTQDGIEYEVRHGEGPHAGEYPFWIWIGLERGGHSDVLTEQAHSVAERLRRHGWPSLVRGYISATGETAL